MQLDQCPGDRQAEPYPLIAPHQPAIELTEGLQGARHGQLLRPPLPLARVAAVMEAGENFHLVRVEAENQAVGKPTKPCATYIAPHSRELARIVAKSFNQPLILIEVAHRQCFANVAVPLQGIGKFERGGRRKTDAH
jgi:hypothetical protein